VLSPGVLGGPELVTNAGADGWTEELVPLPDPPESRTLTRLIGTRVQTIRGPSVLWDHRGTEARIVLDASPKVWKPLDIGELLLSEGPCGGVGESEECGASEEARERQRPVRLEARDGA
jgi:hypothetical protein